MSAARRLRAALLAISLLTALAGCDRGRHDDPAPSDAPRIQATSVTSAAPRTEITLTGAHFETRASRNLVFFGAAQAEVLEARSDELRCIVPAGAPAGGTQLTVTTRTGTSPPRSFTVLASPGAPAVQRIETTAGQPTEVALPGARLRITGSGFAPDPAQNQVWIGPVPASVRTASPTALEIEVPSDAGSGTVGVAANGVASTDGPTLFVCSDTASGLDRDAVGTAAGALLRGAPRTHLLVEIDAQDDGGTVWEPDTSALLAIAARLDERLYKPGAIAVLQPQPFASQRTSWTNADLAALQSGVRDLYSHGNTVVVHVQFVAGSYRDNDRVIGLTWRATEIAVFEQALRDRLGPLSPNASRAEQAVLTHEFGHVLGLVDVGTPMCTPHEDPASPGHDINSDCVMYAEISIRATALQIRQTDFDANCKCDLQRAGGR